MYLIVKAFEESVINVHQKIPDPDPLPRGEFPECPYCDRQLSPSPFTEGLGWKCSTHGTFPIEEFDANVLRAMRTVANEK